MTGAREADDDRAAAEAALMSRIAAGDREAPLIELYDRYASSVYRLGIRMLGDQGRAEELVQETFVRLWQSSGRFDPTQSSARSFLFVLAHRAAVDLRRRIAARPALAAVDPERLEEPAGADEADRMLAGVEVREALESLSPKHREVLELGYDHDLSQRQIAERLDVPLGTVKTRTYHALRALRSEFDRRGLHV